MHIFPSRKILLAAPVLFLTGCAGTFNPHLFSQKLDDDLVAPAECKTTDTQSPICKSQFTDDLNFAFQAANDQRRLYYDGIKNRSVVRNVSGGVLLGLSALTLYKGVTPGNSDITKKYAGWLTGLTGMTYGITSYYSNKDAELAYLTGYKMTTCAMFRMRPLLMTQSDYAAWNSAIAQIGPKIQELDTIALQLDSIKHDKNDKDIKEMRKAIDNARKTLEHAEKLKANIRTAGFVLRRQVDLINAAVSDHIQHNERDTSTLAELVADPGKLNKGFAAIKPIPLEIADSNFGGDEKGEKTATPKAVADTNQPVSAPSTAKKTKKTTKATPAKTAQNDDASLHKTIDALQKNLDEVNKRLTEIQVGKGGDLRGQGLAKVAALYQMRRVVNAPIIEYNALLKTVKNIQICKFSSEPSLTTTPDEDEKVLNAGETYEVVISGGHGYPKVSLTGAKGKQVSLSTVLSGNTAVATVTIANDAEDGEVVLHITDSLGNDAQETRLHIKAKKAEPAKQANGAGTNPTTPTTPATGNTAPATTPS